MNNKKISAFQMILSTIIRYFRVTVVIALLLIALSGVFRVNSNEAAIILRFGKLVGDTAEEQVLGPGLHFSLPYIIDEVIIVPVGKVQELTITTHCGNGAAISPNIKINGYVVTGDSNIVLMKTKVKYTVSDIISYALSQKDIERTIDGIISGEVTALVSSLDVDSVLTSGKAVLCENARKSSQQRLDELGGGVSITSIEFIEVTPPVETKSQFDEVNAAAVKKETMLQTANEQASVLRLDAQAQAQTLIQEAKSNQSKELSRAYEEVAEFNGLLGQYRRNSRSLYDGVFRHRISKLIAQMGATLVVPDSTDGPVVILP